MPMFFVRTAYMVKYFLLYWDTNAPNQCGHPWVALVCLIFVRRSYSWSKKKGVDSVDTLLLRSAA